MKGIIYKGDRIAEIKEFPVPKPSKKEVLVTIKATTICGSDMHKWRTSETELLKYFGQKKIESLG